MKYLIITGVFVLGLSLGYVIGIQTTSINESGKIVMSEDENSDLTESDGHSTSNKHHHQSGEDSLASEDNIILNESVDSTFQGDNTLLGEDHISTEKMVKSLSLPIILLAENSEPDTLMKELLGVEEVQNKSVFVEFWESPLNFEGYKLSKKKLIVYGLSPQFEYKLYRDDSNYFLSYQNVYYKLKETQDFLPFSEVSRNEVFND